MEAVITQALDMLKTYGPFILYALAYALLIIIVGKFITGIITGFVRKMMVRTKIDETLTRFVCSLVRIILLTFVYIAAINQLGINTTSLIVILSAAGLAVGLALQGSLANFSSGVMLILFRPFKTGDFVEASGISGTVEEISIFSTLFKTGDNKAVIVPNSNITGGNIVNYSAKNTRRIDMVFGIGYGDDLKQAKELLMKIVTADERVLKDPEPVVALSELADSSVNFVVRPWVNASDYWGVKCDVTEKVNLTFDERGISIPYPQTDVHIHQTKEN